MLEERKEGWEGGRKEGERERMRGEVGKGEKY